MSPDLEEALNMARCAAINFDNVVRDNRMLAAHPMFKVARWQLACTIARLGGEEPPTLT